MEIKKEPIKNQDLVWAQMRYCPYWPARVVETPPTLGPTPANKVCVLFFGTQQFGFVGRDKIVNYVQNREKYAKKGKGSSFQMAIKHMDEYVSDNVKFRSYACVKPIKSNVLIKTEGSVEKQLGIIKTETSNDCRTSGDVAVKAESLSPSKSWTEEKKTLIDMVVSLKSENQIITHNLNEKLNELNTLKISHQTIEKCLKDKEKQFSSKMAELQTQLSKSIKSVELHEKSMTNLKRENRLLISQSKQLKSAFIEERDEKKESDEGNDIYEVEKILDDKLVTSTERHYLVHWKKYDSSNDTWERESNLSCPGILKKYKQSKKKR